jgi:hypothetical protein
VSTTRTAWYTVKLKHATLGTFVGEARAATWREAADQVRTLACARHVTLSKPAEWKIMAAQEMEAE